jgi:hypothetical protein
MIQFTIYFKIIVNEKIILSKIQYVYFYMCFKNKFSSDHEMKYW